MAGHHRRVYACAARRFGGDPLSESAATRRAAAPRQLVGPGFFGLRAPGAAPDGPAGFGEGPACAGPSCEGPAAGGTASRAGAPNGSGAGGAGAGGAGANGCGGANGGGGAAGAEPCEPMQMTVQPAWGGACWGVGVIHGNIGGELTRAGLLPGLLKSISGTRASGSSSGRPLMFIGRLGPSPSACSRCASASGGGGPVIGGRSTGTTPVA